MVAVHTTFGPGSAVGSTITFAILESTAVAGESSTTLVAVPASGGYIGVSVGVSAGTVAAATVVVVFIVICVTLMMLDHYGIISLQHWGAWCQSNLSLWNMMLEDQRLWGCDKADKIVGGKGNDLIQAEGGDDKVFGGDGNDIIHGDYVGSRDPETINEYERWYAHHPSRFDGNDILDGGNGDDHIYGYGGNDYLIGGNGNDTLDGGTGNDILNGDDGNDKLYGGDGNDALNGGDGDNYLDGGDGDDILSNGPGRDIMIGGKGKDTFILDPRGHALIQDYDSKEDVLLIPYDGYSIKEKPDGMHIYFADKEIAFLPGSREVIVIGPVVKPVEPVVKPIEPVVKPVEPVVKPPIKQSVVKQPIKPKDDDDDDATAIASAYDNPFIATTYALDLHHDISMIEGW